MEYKDNMMGMQDRELEWDDTIENDGSDYDPLPAGDYDFQVIGYERARHTPGVDGKIPPCNKAVVEIAANDGSRTVTLKASLFLHSRMEWKLCEFFVCIGQRKKGDPLKMNWNAAIGTRGRCRLGIRDWTTDKGQKRTANEVQRFLEPVDSKTQSSSRFTEGVF